MSSVSVSELLVLVSLSTAFGVMPGSVLAGECEHKALNCDKDHPFLHVTPKALFQVWATAYDQDLDPQADPAGYGDPEDDPGFKIRRARIGVEGESDSGLFYEVVFGASSPYDTWKTPDTDIGLVDANMGYRHQSFVIAAGQQKVPYSREQLISASDLVFTERAVSTEHLVPDRETGLVGGWAAKGFGVHLGAFNGSGSFLGDDNVGFLFAGRVEYSTAPRYAYSTFGEVDDLVLSVAGNTYYNADLSTDTLAFGGDVLLRVAGLAVLLEGHHAALTPVGTDVTSPDMMDATSRFGGVVQVGYTLGQWEPALRASLYDDDMDTDDNGDVLDMMAGVTWHVVEDHGRLGLGYVHRQELAGRSMPNDTVRLWGQVRY